MKDELKSKKQLIEELNRLRKQIAELTQCKENDTRRSKNSLTDFNDLFINGRTVVIIK